MRSWVIALAESLVIAGCARREPPPPNPALAAGFQKDLEDQLGITRAKQPRERCAQLPRPAIGMTSAQLAASCWGKPDNIAESTTARGTVSGWGYPEGNILLVNGVVTKIDTVR